MEQALESNPPLLEVNEFSLSFRTYGKGLEETELNVIKQLNMTVHEGEIVAIVGASGSGKSLLASTILGILPEHASWKGNIHYRGESMTDEMLQGMRGKETALIPQSVQALNPLMKVGKQVLEADSSINKQQLNELFSRVGLPKETVRNYPFELSGGMTRRVLAVIAMISPARLIIADEPTPGLDPAILKETTNVLQQLAAKGKGIVFISHDIRTALSIADKVVVFNQGKTIEEAKVTAFSGKGEQLKQTYTRKLWNALPENYFFDKDNVRPIKDTKHGPLVANNLGYRYKGAAYLFQDVSLSIEPGEIVGMHGYSGTGKTTLAKILAGYIEPSAGEVRIERPDFDGMNVNPVQLVWQHPEQAINPRWKMKKLLQESGMETSPLLEALGIKQEWLLRWPSELSGGELQRFCLARALRNDTKFLIADEMTTMLDAITQAQLWETICRLASERQIGVLAISHDHQLLHRISNRIINFQEL